MLKPVTRAAPDQPYVFCGRVSIHQKMIIGSVLVLAYSRLEERRIFQSRKSEAQIIADRPQPFGSHHARSCGGIEVRSTSVIGNLKTASFIPWNSVHELILMIGPYRQSPLRKAIISDRSAEEKYILLSGTNKISYHLGKELAKPRPTGKDVPVCHYSGNVG